VSGLADRLVTAASPDVWAVTEACTPEQIDMLVQRTVKCVLLDLAEGLTTSGQPSISVAELLDLAGVVERGEDA
jgi:hypothetical protein